MSVSAARRIGLFGGSFDPVHPGHVQLAQTALQALALDELRWVPARQPWQKLSGPQARTLAPVDDRCAMVALALAGEPRFTLDRSEADRPGPSYTVDTVSALRAAEGSAAELFLVIGQDQYARLHTWHRWPELLAAVTLAVAARQGEAPRPSPELADTPHRLAVLDMPRCDASSTAIRARLHAGEAARDLARDGILDPQVARYIDARGLYGARPSQPNPPPPARQAPH